jgi:MFS family permease
MMSGIFIAIIGIALSFYTNNVFFTILGILIFAIGEMTSNPKFSDYIAKISPKGKEALYMGTYFLPISVANFLTKWITGDLYEKYSDKVAIIRRELTQRSIELPEITTNYTKNNFYSDAADQLKMSQDEMTTFMWDHYHPGNIWYIIAGIGLLTILGLLVYNAVISRKLKNAKN